eukprot:GHVR01109559.1.p1 GENE.GHVR01109559.1~~GHVR01109559.1.p1  ORF type:complete len:360 (+),score=74.58 GHVR01109559.1:41-1120(+)
MEYVHVIAGIFLFCFQLWTFYSDRGTTVHQVYEGVQLILLAVALFAVFFLPVLAEENSNYPRLLPVVLGHTVFRQFANLLPGSRKKVLSQWKVSWYISLFGTFSWAVYPLLLQMRPEWSVYWRTFPSLRSCLPLAAILQLPHSSEILSYIDFAVAPPLFGCVMWCLFLLFSKLLHVFSLVNAASYVYNSWSTACISVVLPSEAALFFTNNCMGMLRFVDWVISSTYFIFVTLFNTGKYIVCVCVDVYTNLQTFFYVCVEFVCSTFSQASETVKGCVFYVFSLLIGTQPHEQTQTHTHTHVAFYETETHCVVEGMWSSPMCPIETHAHTTNDTYPHTHIQTSLAITDAVETHTHTHTHKQ